MAQFNTDIVLNTRVNQASLSKAVRSINQVTSLVRQLKPVNLFAPGRGAGPDKIRVELENILKISKQINAKQTGSGGLASTFAGANDQAQAFLETLKNVNIKARDGSSKAKVQQFADAFVAADKQAKKYEKTLSDVIRKARGLQPQAVRDVEVERRKQFIITEREKRKQAKITADARIKEDKRAADAARKNELKAKRDRDNKKRERSSKLNNLGAAVGFPLLFGGGIGSVAGGAAGALLGGFGGSILGSALGQQFDALTAATISTAKAFEKLGSTANALIPKLGRGVGNGFGGQSEFLIGEGRESQVANILRDQFAQVYGDQALKDFEKLSEVNKEFEQTWNEIGIELQRLMAGPLGAFLEGLKGISNGLNGRDNEGVDNRKELNRVYSQLKSQANKILEGGGQLSIAEKARLESARLASANASPDNQTPFGEDPDKKTAAQKKLIDLLKIEKDVQAAINADKLAAISQALTARRDDLAILNSAAGITKALADLDRTRAQLAAEKEAANRDNLRILQLEKTEAEQAADLERQRIAQANAVALAERQIRQELRGLSIQEFQLKQQINSEQEKYISLSATEKKQYEIKKAELYDQYQTLIDVLTVQEAVALEGKNEIEIRNQITESFKKQKQLAYERVKAQTLEVYQAEVLRQDRLQAISDQEKLNKLTAENAAIRAVDSNDPERTASFSGAGLGFFADSELLKANVIRDSAAQLEEYNEQIAALQQRIKKLSEGNFGGINDARLTVKQEQLDKLTQTRNLYEQLQPAIDAARIKQAQFNDALAAVTPGVNALVGGLQEVVAGTKTAEEAFADFLKTVADQLISTAATMIAQYIAIGLAKAFAGLGGNPGGGGGIESFGGGNPLGPLSGSTPLPFTGFAEGGFVTSPTNAQIGEAGENEYVIPASKMGEAVNRYSNGSRGESVIPGKGGQGGSSGGGADGSTIVNYNGPTLNFDSEQYVPAAAVPGIIDAAAKRGAKEGEQRTFKTLMNSRGQRSRIGL